MLQDVRTDNVTVRKITTSKVTLFFTVLRQCPMHFLNEND
jgi:hypothetical protein